MLSLDIRILHGQFVCTPKLKPASNALSLESCHPGRVHLSWPISYCRSLAGLCTHQQAAKQFQVELIHRLAQSYFPCWILDRIKNALTATPNRTKNKGKVIYIVLPFYGGSDTIAFSRVISSCGSKSRVLNFMQVDSVCASWTLAQPKALDIFHV